MGGDDKKDAKEGKLVGNIDMKDAHIFFCQGARLHLDEEGEEGEASVEAEEEVEEEEGKVLEEMVMARMVEVVVDSVAVAVSTGGPSRSHSQASDLQMQIQ